MVTLRCQVVRWVSDEPQPGWVEARFTDAHGRRWTFFDKPPIFENEAELTPEASYPQEAGLACVVTGTQIWTDGREILSISTRTPWSIESEEGQTEFHVSRDQLIDPLG
ncbi:hypothetical protein [Nonomuraea basaltis]|uniref:hypothetical protein n=1 Tax=Nonomuraea basaltis TaxID=2495887 RepID=UPI0014868FA0|nr:hypothetical protein [Nonomuraea basaltis]